MSEEKRPFEDLALELLNFLEIREENQRDTPEMYPYRLTRASTFLEMKFGHVDALRKEVQELRQWKKDSMPAVVRWSELHTPQKHPLDFSED